MNYTRPHLPIDSIATLCQIVGLQLTVHTSTALNQPNLIGKGHRRIPNINCLGLRDHHANS